MEEIEFKDPVLVSEYHVNKKDNSIKVIVHRPEFFNNILNNLLMTIRYMLGNKKE